MSLPYWNDSWYLSGNHNEYITDVERIELLRYPISSALIQYLANPILNLV